jgi:hypothetical protein
MEGLIATHQREAIEDIMSAVTRAEKGYTNVSAYMASGTGVTFVALEVAQKICRLGARVLIVTQTDMESKQAFSVFGENGSREKPVISISHLLDDDRDVEQYHVAFSTFAAIYKSERWKEVVHRFEVILFLNMNFSRPSKKTDAIREHFNSSQLISISSTPPTSLQSELFGEPVFKYSLDDAMRDGVLQPVHYFIKPTLDLDAIKQNKMLTVFLSTLLADIADFRPDKLLIICRDNVSAELIHKTLERMENVPESFLLSANLNQKKNRKNEFVHSDKFYIGITADISTGVDITALTDIVLLRKITSLVSFLRVLSKINKSRKSSAGRRLWDFGENRRWFKEIYGEITKHESNGGYFGLNYDRKVLFPEPWSDGFSGKNMKRLADDELETDEPSSLDDVDTDQQVYTRGLISPQKDKAAKIDLLGRGGLVSILKGVIDRDSRKHFIIALFGRWGSGKSSVIEILMDRYKDTQDTHFVVFNAWQNGHSQNMTASIAEAFVDSLYSTKTWFGKFWLSLRGQWNNHRSTVMFYLIIAILISILTVFYLGTTGLSEHKYTLPVLGGVLFTVVPLMVWKLLKNPYVSKLEELSKKPSFGTHIGISEDIKRQLGSLIDLYPKTRKPSLLYFWKWRETYNASKNSVPFKYILVVDDLDRCNDKKIIETLETVQLVMDLDNVVVILVVDDDILLRAVASMYESQGKGIKSDHAFKIAREFLGKILQLTITLDPPSLSSRKRFIKERLYKGLLTEETVENKFVETLGFDPKASLEEKALKKNFDSNSVFDYESNDDEDDYDETGEYLTSDILEYEFFKICVQTFEIDNPRTMLRLYNVITFIRGLYPDVANNEEDLKLYIFLVFWYEIYQLSDDEIRTKMQESVGMLDDGVEEPVGKLAEAINLSKRSELNIKKAVYRIKNLSLPVLEAS